MVPRTITAQRTIRVRLSTCLLLLRPAVMIILTGSIICAASKMSSERPRRHVALPGRRKRRRHSFDKDPSKPPRSLDPISGPPSQQAYRVRTRARAVSAGVVGAPATGRVGAPSPGGGRERDEWGKREEQEWRATPRPGIEALISSGRAREVRRGPAPAGVACRRK